MIKKWTTPSDVVTPPELAAGLDGHPLLPELLARRGITDLEAAQRFLDPDAYQPAPPHELPDMDKAVERIEQAIQGQESICVWGDFDVDGQTSTALLVSALHKLGAVVDYYIPHRQNEGHGIHIPRLKSLIDAGASLLLTCDTGITEHAAVDYANSRGVDVIITDHHQLPQTLPRARAAVNPQRLPEGHPLRTLPGVGCAYKVVEALYDSARRSDELPQFLDLVALGIVADVAELTGDTRYLLQRGLQALRNTNRLGLKLIMERAKLVPEQLNESHIGFALGPRLNALGRIDDANAAVELLTTGDQEEASILANRLEGLNAQRRLESDQIYQAAQQQIERDPTLLDDSVLLLSHDTWQSGVVGIVANRLVEQYNRPVILLVTPPDELAHGSARSVAGCDITAAIAAQSELLNGYGGHTMAAGLSLMPENIPAFRRAISRTVSDMLAGVDTTPTLNIETYVALGDLSLDLVDSLERMAPFGPGNPFPVLVAHCLTYKSHHFIGSSGDHLRLTVEDESGKTHEVIWWQADSDNLPRGRFDLAYTVRANDYQGKRELQIEYVDAHPLEEEPLEFSQRATVNIVDYRQQDDKLALLTELEDVVIWSEGEAPPGVDGLKRHELRPAPALAIWTTPPGLDELRQALQAVNPATVYLFGVNPGSDTTRTFLERLGGLVKFALNNYNGEIDPSVLAATTAHREATIRAGLSWLAARRQIAIISDNATLRLAELDRTQQGATSEDEQAQTAERLADLLQETDSYRRHFRRADKTALLHV
jgi:single-stranded-DNA-specific exonuclease